jgi:hypothetical protein
VPEGSVDVAAEQVLARRRRRRRRRRRTCELAS